MTSISKTALVLLTTIGAAHATTLDIDIGKTTVSGLSSGGYMATQFQLAHADIVQGAGIIAAGPYYCAQNAITTALAECVTTTTDEFSIAPLNAYISQSQGSGKIADEAAIKAQSAMVIHGTEDKTVNRKAADLLVEQYKTLGIENIQYVNDKAFSHVFPTVDKGGDCGVSESPFIGACGYDAAGEILQHVYGELSAPVDAVPENLVEFSQHKDANPDDANMSETTFTYIPSSCRQGSTCSVHISFHGCNQSHEDVGDAYARNTGFNRWAESNNLIVLYPQAKKSALFPMNPQGCWDWWGYTDEEYATNEGQQIKAVRAMLDDLSTVLTR